MRLAPSYEIVCDLPGGPLVLRDTSHVAGGISLTNAAESVVPELVLDGRLPDGRRLLYYDTEGRLDEMLVRDGRFAGFLLVPTRRTP